MVGLSHACYSAVRFRVGHSFVPDILRVCFIPCGWAAAGRTISAEMNGSRRVAISVVRYHILIKDFLELSHDVITA